MVLKTKKTVKKSAAKKPAAKKPAARRSVTAKKLDEIFAEADRLEIPLIEIRDRDRCEGMMLKRVEVVYVDDAVSLVTWAFACGAKAVFLGYRYLDMADMMFDSSERDEDGARIILSAGDYDSRLKTAGFGTEGVFRVGAVVGGVSVVSAAEASPGYAEFFERKKLAIKKAREAFDSAEMRELDAQRRAILAQEARAKAISAGAREMSSAPEFFNLPSRAAMGGAIAQAFPDIRSVFRPGELNALVTAVHQQALLARARAKTDKAGTDGAG